MMATTTLTSGRLSPLQNARHGERMPLRTPTWGDAFAVQLVRDRLKAFASRTQALNPLQRLGFAIQRAVGLSALTAAFVGAHALASAAKFEHHHGLVILGDGTHDLPQELAGWIVGAEVRLGHGDQGNSAVLKVLNNVLLHHQVSRQAVQLLDEDRLHAVRENSADHFDPRRPVHTLRRAGDAFLAVDLRDSDSVRRSIALDGFELAREAVTVDLTFAGNSQVRESF